MVSTMLMLMTMAMLMVLMMMMMMIMLMLLVLMKGSLEFLLEIRIGFKLSTPPSQSRSDNKTFILIHWGVGGWYSLFEFPH